MKNISNKIYLKLAILLFILILLQIPILMVKELIDERADYQQQVIEDIARSSTTEQDLVGPFLEVTREIEVVGKNGPYIDYDKKYLIPNTLNFDADIDTFEKYRGIYKARLYQAKTGITGKFNLSALEDRENIIGIKLIVGIRDSRGIIQLGKMNINQVDIDVMPGSGIKNIGQGFHAELTNNMLTNQETVAFDLNFVLQGTNTLNVLPVGANTDMAIRSTWQHPSFNGKFLPIASTISQNGFEAKWATNKLTSNIENELSECLYSSNRCTSLNGNFMSVNFIEPVDHYLKSERSVDYSLLIIFLVFASFFVLEVFQSRPVHPIQYGFAGLAAATFYLLLISLSEHVGFDLAYLISAIASVSLLTIYASSMLDKTLNKVFYFIGLLIIYALAFGILQAESYALLMGAAICFFILSVLMILTRNVDWYAQGNKLQANKMDDQQTKLLQQAQGVNHEDKV